MGARVRKERGPHEMRRLRKKEKTLDPRLLMSRMTEGDKADPFLRQAQDRRFAQDDTSGVLCRMTEEDKRG